jgi:hypothetical protein
VHNLSEFLIEVAQPAFIKHLSRERRKLEKPRAAPATYTHREFCRELGTTPVSSLMMTTVLRSS